MARMPGTTYIGPTVNMRPGGMIEVHGLVLHIQDGYEEGSEAWFRNPDSEASSHFLNPKAGGLRQMVDTADRAWAEAAGNPYWVSVENEGFGGDSLTASQLENCAQLLAWLHHAYATPLQTTDDTMGRGLAWHGMGGAAWGGHPDCPGKNVLAARGAIVQRAKVLAGVTLTSVSLAHVIAAAKRDPFLPQGGVTWPADVRVVEGALRSEGLLAAVYAADGSFGSKTTGAYSEWQRTYAGGHYAGADADGIPGVDSLTRLGKRHGFTVV